MRIAAAELLHAKIPLTHPYVLSFVTVEYVDSVVIRLTLDDGRQGVGEAVPLTGYSEESLDSLLSDLGGLLPVLPGRDAETLGDVLDERLPHSPFACSAVQVAAETALREVEFPTAIRLPMVAPVSASADVARVLTKADDWLASGYRTIKLKVGREVGMDCDSVNALLTHLPDGVRLRVDANQGYDENSAERLLDTVLGHARGALVELIEQPFDIPEWTAFERLVRRFPDAPLMLDESILEDADVDRAAGVGATYVKLKLFKHRGVAGLLALARHANDLGLRVVMGNGVATDVGNLVEAAAFQSSGLFAGAFEGNGFEKLVSSALAVPPGVDRGDMVWHAHPDAPLALADRRHEVLLRSAC